MQGKGFFNDQDLLHFSGALIPADGVRNIKIAVFGGIGLSSFDYCTNCFFRLYAFDLIHLKFF